MNGWTLVHNPAYTNKTPRLLEPDCCDRSAFITCVCVDCGHEMHLHETQTAQVPPGAGIASKCQGCGELLVFEPGAFAEAFAMLRAQGWLA